MTPTEIVSAHIDQSIARALKGESWLDPEVLKIHGFSTPTMRHLFNNLCHLEDIAYLEVGVFKGASFVAAFNNNPIRAFGIDNFAQDFSQKGVRDQLADNLNRWKHTARAVQFVEDDCFEVAKRAECLSAEAHPGFDIFCYDGHHDFTPTSNALPSFFHLLADRFIFIVDDFHWDSVSSGVQMGFNALAGRVNVERQWTLSGNRAQDDKIWWNGLAIFACSKIKNEPSFNTELPPTIR